MSAFILGLAVLVVLPPAVMVMIYRIDTGQWLWQDFGR